MKDLKDYTIEELNIEWNETMWEMDVLYETIQDCLREDTPSMSYEEEHHKAGMRIAALNQEFIRRGIDTPED